jgi:hypothetical protein
MMVVTLEFEGGAMLKEIRNPGRKLLRSEITDFEREINKSLPEDYVDFLLKYNGGSPYPCEFNIDGHDEGICGVQVFFGINREIESSTLSWNYCQYKDRIPAEHIPIGCSDTNDLICLLVSDDKFGTVVFWDAINETSKNSLDNVYCVSVSFDAFLGSLFSENP